MTEVGGPACGGVITGTSVPATTTNGTGTIYSEAQIPDDCSLAYVSSESKSLTCTSRPSGQHWYFAISCPLGGKFDNFALGNIVVGDGTSTATCDGVPAADTGAFEISSG